MTYLIICSLTHDQHFLKISLKSFYNGELFCQQTKKQRNASSHKTALGVGNEITF